MPTRASTVSSSRRTPLFEPSSQLQRGPVRSRPLGRHFRGAPRRDEPPFEEGCDEPEGGVSGKRVSHVRQATDEGENIAAHPTFAPHDPTRPARPDREIMTLTPIPTSAPFHPAVPSDGPGVHLLADVPHVHESQGGVQAHDVSQTCVSRPPTRPNPRRSERID